MLMPPALAQRTMTWRTPAVIAVCGCLIGMMTFGPRSTLGFFLTPLSQAHGWGRDVFALALAVQNLLWGLGQPLAGAIADRYGATRVLSVGALLYAAGLVMMAYATNAALLELSAGLLIGFGLSGCAFTVVLGAFGKLLPEHWRSVAFGAGTAAGSFGHSSKVGNESATYSQIARLSHTVSSPCLSAGARPEGEYLRIVSRLVG